MKVALLALFALILTGCPSGKTGKPAADSGSGVIPSLSVTLLCTDLGLGDGELVREAHETLDELSRASKISYIQVGDLPLELASEGGTGDVGLPGTEVVAGDVPAGAMSLDEAAGLAAQVKDCDILIASGPLAAAPLLKRIDDGKLKVGAAILLDTEGPPLPQTKAKVLSIDYDIAAAAYLLGVAAGTSSRTQAFLSFTNSQDPKADVFVRMLDNGIRYRMAGGGVLDTRLTPGDDGVIVPQDFSGKLAEVLSQGLKCNHYIVALGRATPSIMHALSSKPTNGYLLGGYGNFTQVRPARVVSCITKHPGVGLMRLLDGAKSVAEVGQRAPKGMLTLGMSDGAVDVTTMDSYANFNPDAEDIEQALADARAQIESGELDILK